MLVKSRKIRKTKMVVEVYMKTTNMGRDQRKCMVVQGITRDASVEATAGQSLGGKNRRHRGPWRKPCDMLPA